MKLHTNEKLFRQAILATSQQLGIQEIYIEKDYWVTLALKLIFSSQAAEYVVFKGGTSLSKCHKLIQRFSEDIDLVVIHEKDDSANQKKSKIKNIGKALKNQFSELEIEGLTKKLGMNRKTAHEYPKVFKGDFGQIREFIVLEATWLGCFEPYNEQYISSVIYDMMLEKKQEEIADEYQLDPFKINVLKVERTICEKIMSLVRFSYEENYIESLQDKIRHTYDLHLLLQNKKYQTFFKSEGFAQMLNRVATDDKESYRHKNEWLDHHPSKSKIFGELDTVWPSLKGSYENDFANLVYGSLPHESSVKETLKNIYERMNSVSWGS